jgi:hypothetical protein
MVFPQIPIQTRFVVAITAFLLVIRRGVLHERTFWTVVLYAIYITIVGLVVIYSGGDGKIADALYGLRLICTVLIVIVFVSAVPLQWLLLFLLACQSLSLVGLLLDQLRGPAQRWVPFPIFGDVYLTYIAGRHGIIERFGGFTFEAGIVGGIAAYFMLLILCLVFLGYLNRGFRIRGLWRWLGYAGVLLGFAITAFAKTKSGLVVLAGGGMAVTLATFLMPRQSTAWVRGVIIATFAIAVVAASLVWTGFHKSAMGNYLQNEIDRVHDLSSGGLESAEDGAGLKTRIDSAWLALYALPYRPFGAGMTSGYWLVKPVIGKVEVSDEMEEFYREGRYMGFKGYIFDMVGYGGFVGLGFLFLLLRSVYKAWAGCVLMGAKPVALGLVFGLVLLGLTVELLPFLEIVVLTALAGVSAQRAAWPDVAVPEEFPGPFAYRESDQIAK